MTARPSPFPRSTSSGSALASLPTTRSTSTWPRSMPDGGGMTSAYAERCLGPGTDRQDALQAVEQRVLWLSAAIVHHANRVRSDPSGLKVGGHQASSASMVTIMTELWFRQLRPADRVSVKPHASPVLHAINYLLGELDACYLTMLREFGGLQSYPSRV